MHKRPHGRDALVEGDPLSIGDRKKCVFRMQGRRYGQRGVRVKPTLSLVAAATVL